MASEKVDSITEKLNLTKQRLSALSQKVTQSTKTMISSTNESIKSSVAKHKEKREQKAQEKVEAAKNEISQDGLMEEVPPMITLPEFEEEKMEIVTEQNETMITIVEEMQRLSERLDSVEKRFRNLNISEKKSKKTPAKQETPDSTTIEPSPVMREVIHLLGASLVWIVVLFGIDKYLSDNAILILDSYPAEIPIWGIGALSWSYYLLQRLGKSSKALQLPKLLMIQTSMAVGITTTFGLMVNDETMTTVSNVWIWGTVIAIGLLFASSLIASAWSSTKKLVGFKNDKN
tara:strand:- start:2192 stop:3058 length:867 start_codon:yes stop_codon:yes gene_type:complete